MAEETTTPPTTSEILLAQGHRFFLRLLDMPPDVAPRDVGDFVRLTIEGISPFPLQQLAIGWHVFPESGKVLAFAAYRKIFRESELKVWEQAAQVFPEFAPALTLAPKTDRLTLVIWRTNTSLTGILWPANAKAPTHICSREFTEGSSIDAFTELCCKRFGVARSTLEIVEWIQPADGPFEIARGGFTIVAEGTPPPPRAFITHEQTECWDIRPVEFLEAVRRERQRALVFWRVAVGLAAGLALLVAGEIVLSFVQTWNTQRNTLAASRAAAVQAVQDSEQLATRLTELTSLQLRPFDKLGTLAGAMPESVYFSRVSSQGMNTLVIDAIARNPGDVPVFEGRLQALPGIRTAQAKNQQFRDNVTTFTLEVNFVESRQNTPALSPAPAPAPEAAPQPEPASSWLPATDAPAEPLTIPET
jgi:Tfp pilus assembly protein PilN